MSRPADGTSEKLINAITASLFTVSNPQPVSPKSSSPKPKAVVTESVDEYFTAGTVKKATTAAIEVRDTTFSFEAVANQAQELKSAMDSNFEGLRSIIRSLAKSGEIEKAKALYDLLRESQHNIDDLIDNLGMIDIMR